MAVAAGQAAATVFLTHHNVINVQANQITARHFSWMEGPVAEQVKVRPLQ